MNFYSVALNCEAQAIIDALGLIKSTHTPFSIYENKNTKLIISGIGVINTAMATTYLLTKFDAKKDDTIINIGIAGASFEANKGEFYFVNKIIYHDKVLQLSKNSDKTYKKLTTFDTPQNDKKKIKNSLVDMEGYGFFVAAKKFIASENIQVLKVVSDMVEDTIPLEKEVVSLIEKLVLLQEAM